MATSIQITIDCADAPLLTRFWATALGYVVPAPPAGFDDWTAYWRSVGVPEDELDVGDDRLVDPDGVGPSLWFQQVPEPKVVKNRLHLDLDVGGGRAVPLKTRRSRVDAEAIDHYAVVMADPEGNEFCLH